MKAIPQLSRFLKLCLSDSTTHLLSTIPSHVPRLSKLAFTQHTCDLTLTPSSITSLLCNSGTQVISVNLDSLVCKPSRRCPVRVAIDIFIISVYDLQNYQNAKLLRNI